MRRRRHLPHVPPTRRRPFVLVVTPEPHEDATPTERLALEVRNRASRSGVCACGALAEFVGVDELGFGHLLWRHENDCPAISSAAGRAVGARP